MEELPFDVTAEDTEENQIKNGYYTTESPAREGRGGGGGGGGGGGESCYSLLLEDPPIHIRHLFEGMPLYLLPQADDILIQWCLCSSPVHTDTME